MSWYDMMRMAEGAAAPPPEDDDAEKVIAERTFTFHHPRTTKKLLAVHLVEPCGVRVHPECLTPAESRLE